MITIILGRAAQFLLALATMRVATTLLTPEEMGKVSLVITTIAFFALFLINPVGMFINRRLHAWQASGVARHYLVRYVNYLLASALIAAVTLLLLNLSGAVNFGMPASWLIAIVSGSLLFNTINQTSIPSLNLLGDSKRFVWLTVGTIAASLICATLLVLIVQSAAQYWLLGLLLGQIVLGVVGTRVLFEKLNRTESGQALPAIRKRNLRALFDFAWPIALAVGLGWIQNQSYRYLMEGSLGFTELGLFVAGYGISAGLIAAFDSIFTAYFQPKFYKQIIKDNIDEQSDAWHEYARAILPALLLTGLFIIASAPDLTQLLLGPSFRQSSEYVVWGALAESARIATAVFGMVAYARMNTRMLLLPNLVGATMSLFLVWHLMQDYGAAGVGMGLVASSILALLLTIFMVSRHMVIELPKRQLMTCAIMGGMLMLLTEIIRRAWSAGDSYLFSLVLLSIVGLIFLLFQFSVLRPILQRQKAFSVN